MTVQAVAMFKILMGMIDKDAADDMLDVLENKVKATPSKIDDLVVLSLISTLRMLMGIPDGDD